MKRYFSLTSIGSLGGGGGGGGGEFIQVRQSVPPKFRKQHWTSFGFCIYSMMIQHQNVNIP